MSTLALIGLGSNLGDRKAMLDGAIAALAETKGVEVRRVSSYHETAPVGGPAGQGAFLNASVAVETSLPAPALHNILRGIENEAGRVRIVRWGKRTLDLDLLLFGDQIIDSPELTVPHPRMTVRRFVLAPLAEIAPSAIDPLTSCTIERLLANLDRRPSLLVLVGTECDCLFRRLATTLNAVGLFDGTVSDASYWTQSDILKGPDFSAILRQKTIEWHVDRWSSHLWGERWIITDFWFDQIDHDQTFHFGGSEKWRQEFLEARAQTVRPTFLVAIDAYSHEQLWRWRAVHSEVDAIGRDVPIFWPRKESPWSRFDHPASHEKATRRSLDGETDEMVTEILAACASARPDLTIA